MNGGARPIAATLLWLALPLPIASAVRSEVDGYRVYEVDLGPTGAPWLGAIPADELGKLLKQASFEAIVLWLPADDPRLPEGAIEPHARGLAEPGTKEGKEEAPPAGDLGPLAASFQARGLAVALGRRRTADVPVFPHHAPDRAITIDTKGRPTITATRVTRPAVRDFVWCRRLPPATSSSPEPLALSSRLAATASETIRAKQSELDVWAFSAVDHQIERRIELQSLLANAWAAGLAGDAPELFDPFTNEWLAELPPRPLAPLRRGEPLLDLEECSLTLQRDGATALAANVGGNGMAGAWWVDGLLTCFDYERDVAEPGELTIDQADAWGHLLLRRRVAIRSFARLMAIGPADRSAMLREVHEALDDVETSAALLPEPMRAAWLATVAADRTLLAAAEPWRIRFTTWSVARAGSSEPPREDTLARVDDPRLGAWGPQLEQVFGGRDLDLWKFFTVEPKLEVTLRTQLALRDPRNVRLRVDAAATRSVRVNGAIAVEPLAGARGPLLATLPLPAGSSSIEIALTLDDASGRVGLELDLLPNRVEGILLDPDRASRVNEPAVRLHDPTALGQTSLVRPAGRTVGASGHDAADRFGSAALPFPLASATRFDVWVHVLPLADRASTLALGFDDGATQEVALAPASTWIWVRAPAPATLAAADHALRIVFPTENVRVDQAVLFATELVFPRAPDGRVAIAASAWRFDPLGSGIVLDLPQLRLGEYFGRSFSLDKGGSFDVFVWLKGSDPLASGQWAELDLSSPSGRQRFVLPAGTPYEEWVALGSVSFASDERIELKAQGQGALARVALVR